MKDGIKLHQIFKQNRKRMNMTQGQMAKHLQMSRGMYGSYEEGRATPRFSKLLRIARSLGYFGLDDFLQIKKQKLPPIDQFEKRYRSLPAEKKKIVDLIIKMK
jgi:transcriptional regulator with XRE-family HTH domain